MRAISSGNMLEDREERSDEESFRLCMSESPSRSANGQYSLVVNIAGIHTSHCLPCDIIWSGLDSLDCHSVDQETFGKLSRVLMKMK